MINKKALIITFHCCPNYGAILQTYGLYTHLSTLFREVEVLDYEPESLMHEYKYINTYSIFSIAQSLLSLPDYISKRKKFKQFTKQFLRLTPCYKNIKEISSTDADFCFVGSDQIWNPEITHGYDAVYFGCIPHNNDMRVIAYAASLGNENLSKENISFIKKHLLNVNNISVRESSAKNILNKIQDSPVSVTLDPTLLAGVEPFKIISSKPKNDSPYVLIYSLNNSSIDKIRSTANTIATMRGLKLIEISGTRRSIKVPNHKVYYNLGLDEFIGMIANAEYVVTDSFHGTAFSLLFHRPFITLPHKSRGSRMANLLNMVGLGSRLTDMVNNELIENEIDWVIVDKILLEQRRLSDSFIRDAIK